MLDSFNQPPRHIGKRHVDELDQLEQSIALDAPTVDENGTFPHASIARLADAGLLTGFFEKDAETLYPQADHLSALLTRIGRGSLTVGRLFEGHVNGAMLINTYGNDYNRQLALTEAHQGRLIGVWNAERDEGLIASRHRGGWLISGKKVFCSGAGSISRPIITARDQFSRKILMMMPEIDDSQVDLSKWRATGMRGTATGSVTFDRFFVSDSEMVGGPDDYPRSPLFSGGAWRVLAVQFGGLQRILSIHAERLNQRGELNDDPAKTRFAIAAQNLELARLLVSEACKRFNDVDEVPAAIDAYVDGARNAFEELAMQIIMLTWRNAGLASLIAPDPLDLVIRDLETYLRQPFLDASRNNAAKWLLHRKGRFDHE